MLYFRLAPCRDGGHALDRAHGSSDEPLRLLRITAAVLLLFGTAVAVALALSGIAPRAILLVGVFWAIYGFIVGLTSGVLEPVIDGLSARCDVGLMRAGGGYSAIETLVVRGDLAAAAEAYRERAQRPADRVEATVRRAALLAGPLAQPETALVELEALQREPVQRGCDLGSGWRWWTSTSVGWAIPGGRWSSCAGSSTATLTGAPRCDCAASSRYSRTSGGCKSVRKRTGRTKACDPPHSGPSRPTYTSLATRCMAGVLRDVRTKP